MTWLTPIGLLGLIGLIILIIIYIIKPNYQNKVISSTFVWRLSLKYRKKRMPLSKLHNILLFLCQFLILTICALLLAQPVISSVKLGDENEKVIIIEDVMTSGKALKEILPKLEAAANVQVVGMIISVDRREKALDSDLSAVAAAKKEYGIDVYSVVTMDDIIAAIENDVIDGREHLAAMYNYRNTYGAK